MSLGQFLVSIFIIGSIGAAMGYIASLIELRRARLRSERNRIIELLKR